MVTASSKKTIGNWSSTVCIIWVVSFCSAVCVVGEKDVDGQDTFNWIGSGQSEEFFHFPSNWLQNETPGPNDSAQFSISFGIPITINFENGQSVGELHLPDNDLTFRSFDFLTHENQTTFATSTTEIDGDAKLTLTRGLDSQGFHLIAGDSTLHGEINVIGGTRLTADTIMINADEVGDASLLRVSGEYEGVPSLFEAENLDMGNNTRATLTIENGAMATIANSADISAFAGEGTLNIIGNDQSTYPSQLISSAVLSGPGSTTTVSGRSLLETSRMGTHEDPGAPSSIRVTSPDATIEVNGLFTVSGGRVYVEDGGTFLTEETFISKANATEGYIQLQSTQPSSPSRWHNSGNVYLAGNSISADPVGGELLIDGGQLEIGGLLKLWGQAQLTMSTNNNMPTQLIADAIENTLGGVFEFNCGMLSVNWFEGDLESIAGMLAPGDDAIGRLPGRTVVAGNYMQGPDATLALDIGGIVPVAEYDLIEIGGFMLADGDLELLMQNSFTPSPTDEIVIISTANIIGSFRNVASGDRVNTVDGSGSFRVDYGFASSFAPNQVVLSEFESATLLIGDVNGDGRVDLLDVEPFVDAIINGTFLAAADINQDGIVNLLDVQVFVDLLVS